MKYTSPPTATSISPSPLERTGKSSSFLGNLMVNLSLEVIDLDQHTVNQDESSQSKQEIDRGLRQNDDKHASRDQTFTRTRPGREKTPPRSVRDRRASLSRRGKLDGSCISLPDVSYYRGKSDRDLSFRSERSFHHSDSQLEVGGEPCWRSSHHQRKTTRKPKDEMDDWKKIKQEIQSLKDSQKDFGKRQKRAVRKVKKLTREEERKSS